MTMKRLPKTDLDIHHLCLGGNVFGWSASKSESEEVLSYYADNGGNFIDTADMYSQWGEGHVGGESETIIGDWMKKRGNRSKMVIATKVAKLNTRPGLSAKNILAACDDSLRRLQTDYIDLYYAHQDDPDTPIEESLQAFDSLVRSGKVRYIASSNFSADRMQESLRISNEASFASYIAVQEHYNLIEREPYESGMRKVVAAEGLSILPYFGLARGFLTGKYRPGTVIDSVRAGGVAAYQNEEGWKLLSKLDSLANHHKTTVSAIALAWLRSQPTVAAPIASARNINQLKEIMPLIELSADELQLLTNS